MEPMDSVPLMIGQRFDSAINEKESQSDLQHNKVTSRAYRSLRVLIALGTLILCVNVVVLMAMISRPWAFNISTTCTTQSATEPLKPHQPEYGWKTYHFPEDETDYAKAMELDDDSMWKNQFWSNVPTGTGYHVIPNPKQYGLPPSRPMVNSTTGEEGFLATFAHQLHCIGVLRVALLSPEGRQDGKHIYHCLEKLRRGIICAGDTTSEAGTFKQSDDGRWHWSFDDWRQPHTCRNWDNVRAWMEEHRWNEAPLREDEERWRDLV